MAGTDFTCPACGSTSRIPHPSEVRINKPVAWNTRLAFRRCYLVYAAMVILYFTVPYHRMLPFAVEDAPIATLWHEWDTSDFENWWDEALAPIKERASASAASLRRDPKFRELERMAGLSAWVIYYRNDLDRFKSEGGRVYLSFLPYFIVKKGIQIAVLLGIPILLYFSVLWIVKGLKTNDQTAG